jgi:hypothetical protein
MPEPPNVIVCFTDQQRWDTTGVHGNPLDLTPNLDRLAQRGTHVSSSRRDPAANVTCRLRWLRFGGGHQRHAVAGHPLP